MVRRWSGVSKLVLALSVAFLAGGNVSASTLVTYSTSGTVESSGVTGSGVISFKSLTNASFDSPSFFSLGDFQVAALPAGESTVYKNTPFSITLIANEVDGGVPVPNGTPIVISGVLDGTVTGGKQSTVRALFNPIGEVPFMTGAFANVLTLPVTDIYLVPSTTNEGVTTAEAHLRTSPVPEPTTIALFLTTLAGLGLRHRFRTTSPV
ncbi:PEP-CTERM sorting domain-containing protein [Singulisphaera sp. GP187]|uniref:PEP-CTERM sorting domain-containing protein n=1 Tax=Singulisphaera sp. GP187 TaxID=1882752 RepID=UPI0020B11134|nr:PEP-CTERM sorting domain-containing protein [Singulisphaera sp. GP187]